MDKYTRWYNQITDRARIRSIDTYTETHHIQPRSLGGTNEVDNLVELTAREHFICHWLLTKMYTGEAKSKMINALWMMQSKNTYQDRYQTKITSRVYESLRQDYARYISDRNTGRVQPPEEKIKQVAAQTGRKRAPFSEEWLANMSKSKTREKNNRWGVEVLESTRQKIGNKIRGRKQTEEEKQRRGEANRGKVKPKQLCPHCQKMIAVNTYTRWHGDQCKQNPGRVSDEN